MNPLAEELNRTLENVTAGRLLSDLGKRLFFPRGIVAQSEEAGRLAGRFNATAGIAFEHGVPLHLSGIRRELPGLPPGEVFPYAPTGGMPRLRELWRQEIYRKNPLLGATPVSLPAVTAGLTHGISLTADLFLDPGDRVLLPDLHWDNYDLIFRERREAEPETFPFFNSRGGFNLEGMEEGLRRMPPEKTVLLLNFPNNPTGYTPLEGEVRAMTGILETLAWEGRRILVICDDAYFGLCYEEGLFRESPFALLADLHENLLAVKVDGATKEEFTWGFRVGFLTMAGRGLSREHFTALETKLLGAVRSGVSSCSRPAQSLLIRALEDPERGGDKARGEALLAARYRKIREILDSPARRSRLIPLPFNSGYFLTFRLEAGGAESLRRILLEEYGVGIIALDDRTVRVTYSSVDLENLEALFRVLDEAAEKL